MKSRSKFYSLFFVMLPLAIIINGFILVNSFIPGEESAAASFWVADILAILINAFKPGTINSGNILIFSYVIRKVVGHFALFLVNGALTGLTIYSYQQIKSQLKFWYATLFLILGGIFIASLSEAIQLLIPGRVGSFSDVLIDVGGYLFSAIILFLVFFFYERKQSKKSQ
ncbi:MAG TPA: VanZ family protein [Bacilli bacterium]|jgi:VanZ family protein|nr:VanZ family protein [Bacilli bacterium]HPY79835.1 VanZ family protein [Bacilli bacterium]HQA55729.1 VanZ family protein [Bacilli bacterium]